MVKNLAIPGLRRPARAATARSFGSACRSALNAQEANSRHPEQGDTMNPILPAYKTVGERRYRETSGLYWEDFQPGDVFEHRPGRTVLDVDNTYFTLLTLNLQQVHFEP